jgi:hypothetical protein
MKDQGPRIQWKSIDLVHALKGQCLTLDELYQLNPAPLDIGPWTFIGAWFLDVGPSFPLTPETPPA